MTEYALYDPEAIMDAPVSYVGSTKPPTERFWRRSVERVACQVLQVEGQASAGVAGAQVH